MNDVLVLNNSYEALSVVSFQRAVALLFKGRAEVLADTGKLCRSAGNRITRDVIVFPLPSVIRLLYYVSRQHKGVMLTKKAVLLRDNYRCAYCDHSGSQADMNVDHVQPRSRGGRDAWGNLVASCQPCNSRKGNRTPAEAGMTLLRRPFRPTFIPYVVIARHTLPDEWAKYLSLYTIGIEERPR